MGADKEATDLWKFGRVRPDLTPDETFSAPEPELTDEEKARRQRLLSEHVKERTERLLAPSGVRPIADHT